MCYVLHGCHVFVVFFLDLGMMLISHKLIWLSDALRPEDVGLTPELPYFRAQEGNQTQAITYLHLFECEKFSVSESPFSS